MSSGMGYNDPSLVTETQDPVNLEMAAYNSVISKEEFGIITTTQEGILNNLHMMSDEIGKHTSLTLNKLDEMNKTTQPKTTQGKKNPANSTPVENQVIIRRIALQRKPTGARLPSRVLTTIDFQTTIVSSAKRKATG